MNKFYIGCTDYFGKDTTPDTILNDKLVPLLKNLGITDTKIGEVVKIIRDIAEAAYSNGADNRESEINEYN